MDVSKKDLEEPFIVPMIFNMQNFKDVIFFYLYGALKSNVAELYPDKLSILDRQFFKESKRSDKDPSWSDSELGILGDKKLQVLSVDEKVQRLSNEIHKNETLSNTEHVLVNKSNFKKKKSKTFEDRLEALPEKELSLKEISYKDIDNPIKDHPLSYSS